MFSNLTLSSDQFLNCTSLLEATFPPKMTSSTNAFGGCSALRKLNMNDITSIGYAALQIPCSDGHTHLYLCKEFTTFGNYWEYNGNKYTIILASTEVRANQPQRNLYAAYVPDEAVADYKAAWPNKANVIHPISELDE